MRWVILALVLGACAPTQSQMEDDYRGGKTFCEAHGDSLPPAVCPK